MQQAHVIPGITLRVWLGAYWHYGVLIESGRVIHNSKLHGCVIEEPLHLFSEGKPAEVCRAITSHNLPLACLRARQLLGLTYSLFTQNCEHFVRLAHGLIPASPQIQKAALVTTGIALMTMTSNPRLQLTAVSASIATLLTQKGGSPVTNAIWGAILGLSLSLAM